MLYGPCFESIDELLLEETERAIFTIWVVEFDARLTLVAIIFSCNTCRVVVHAIVVLSFIKTPKV